MNTNIPKKTDCLYHRKEPDTWNGFSCVNETAWGEVGLVSMKRIQGKRFAPLGEVPCPRRGRCSSYVTDPKDLNYILGVTRGKRKTGRKY